MSAINYKAIFLGILSALSALSFSKNSMAQVPGIFGPTDYINAADELKELYLFSTNFETAPSTQMVGAVNKSSRTHFPTLWGSEFGYSFQIQELTSTQRNAFEVFGLDPESIPRFLYFHRVFYSLSFSAHSQLSIGATFNLEQKIYGGGFEYQKKIFDFNFMCTSVKLGATYGFSPNYFWSYLGSAVATQSIHIGTLELMGAYQWHYGGVSFVSNEGELNFSNLRYNGFSEGDHNFEVGVRLPFSISHSSISAVARFGVRPAIYLQFTFRKPTHHISGYTR